MSLHYEFNVKLPINSKKGEPVFFPTNKIRLPNPSPYPYPVPDKIFTVS